MKKNRLILFICLVLLACTLMLTACGSVDEQQGPTNGPSASPTDNSTTDGTTACAHTFGEWVVTKDATCTEEGVKLRKCTACDKGESEYISPQHQYCDLICLSCNRCEICGLTVDALADHVKTEYYNAYTCRNEIPQGIYALSDEDRRNAADCYRITTVHDRVIRLELVNSQGTVIDPVVPTPLSDYPRQDFMKFDEQGRPTEIDLYNAQGVLMRRKLLQYQDDDNQIIIDFQQVGTDSSQTMVTELTSGINDESIMITPSHILRQVNTYNEEGMLIRTAYYKDTEGTPACDSRYIYVKEFEYTDRGQVARITNLDINGQRYDRIYDFDVQEFTYDETGTVTSVAYCAEIGQWGTVVYGYSSTTYVVDKDNGNVLQSQRLDKNDAPCSDVRGVSRTDYTYNSQGFLVSRKQFDSEGQPAWDNNGCHEYAMTYEPESGRIRQITCKNAQGEPCPNLYGYATVEVIRDAQGRELENWLYDDLGNLCQHMELGICGTVYTYNDQGLRESCCYYGEQRQAALTSDGYHRKQMGHDERGNLIFEAWYDTEGNAVYRDGYAVRKTEYNAQSNVIAIRFYDENGAPVLNSEGYHMVQTEYGDTIYQVFQSFLDTGEQLTVTTGGYAMLERSIGSLGELCDLRYYDKDRWQIAFLSKGFDGIDRIYWGILNEQGTTHSSWYTDLDGNPVMGPDGYHEWRTDLDELGQTIRIAQYDLDGNLVCNDDGYAIRVWEREYYTKNKQTVSRLKSIRFYDENGEPTLCPEGYHERCYDYDSDGRIMQHRYYDAEGNLINVQSFIVTR